MRLLLALLLALLPYSAEAALTVTLRPQAEVRQAQVTLADVAALTGPAEEVAAVESLIIAPAPGVGFTRTVRREQVAARLAQSRPSLAPRFTGAPVVTVSRAAQTVSAATLDQVAQDCLRQAAGLGGLKPALPDRGELQLTPMSSLSDATLPAGEVQVLARPIGPAYGARRGVTLTLVCDGQIARTLTVNYRARLEVEALVAVRALRAGETITPSCWTTSRSDIAGLAGRPLPASELGGRRVRRAVSAGDLLTADNTEPIPLVTKGSPVRVSLRAGVIGLSCEGVAKADGAAGQALEIVNTSSGQTFQAVVTGPGQAEIILQENRS